MSYFEFPHTRTYDSDLGWIVRQIIKINSKLENFINLNTIKYADPIAWNIITQYESNTVVINPENGTAYISTKPVPSGVLITNEEYWTPIFNYGESMEKLREQIAALNEGSRTTASEALEKGTLVWLNELLYRAISNIAPGTEYIQGVNVEQVTIELLIKELQNYVDEAISDITGRITKGVLNVKDYGAVGNGIADDTKAIQAAINDAEESGYALHIPEGTYLVSTLWISNNIYLFGDATLQAYPIRYDSNTEIATAGTNTITVRDGSIYNPNMIITVKSDAHSEVMAVTDVSGNTLTCRKFRYYDEQAASDVFRYTYPAGSDIHINTVPVVITAHIHTVPVESDNAGEPITSVFMDGISVLGSHLGYDYTKNTIYDITLNGCLFAYRVSGLRILNGIYGNCYNNAIAILGRSRNIIVDGLEINNVNTPSEITDVGLKDVAGGVLLHWDQRKAEASEIPSNYTISNNIILHCYNGIFVSASRSGNIMNNKIDTCYHNGIEVYSGDLGFGSFDINVTENSIKNIVNSDGQTGNAIDLHSTTRTTVSGNIISLSQRGINARIGELCLINNNEIISCTDADIYIGRLNGKVSGNIITSGAGCRATVEVNNTTLTDITVLEFSNNYYNGYNTIGAAIAITKGTNVTILNECCFIRALLKIADSVTQDTIKAFYCSLLADNSQLALTQEERSKILSSGVYIKSLNVTLTSGSIMSKTTAERDRWFGVPTGQIIYNTTTSTLQVYNGSAWVNV